MRNEPPEFLSKCDLCQNPKVRWQVKTTSRLDEEVGYVCHDCDNILYESNMKRIEFFKSLLCVPAAFLAKPDSPDKDELPVKLLKCQTRRGRPIAIFWLRGVEKPMVYYWVFPDGNKTYELHKEWRDNERFGDGPENVGWAYYEGDQIDLNYGPATAHVSELFPNTKIIEIQAYHHWQWTVVKKNRETT